MIPNLRFWLARIGRSRLSSSVIALGVSTVIGKGFMLLALVVATRSAGPSGWGQFAYSLTLLYLIQVIADFGFHTYIMRESARGDWTAQQKYSVIQSRLILGAVASLSIIGVIGIMGKPLEITVSLAILSVSLLFRAFYGTQRSSLQGLERMWSTAGLDAVLYGGFLLSVLGLAIISSVTPQGLSWGWTISSLLCAITGMIAFRRSLEEREGLSSAKIKYPVSSAMRNSLPFLAVNVAVVFLHRIGIIVLERYRPADVVGHFAAAYTIFDALSLIPGLLVTAVFPRLARGSSSSTQLRYLTPVVVSITLVPTVVVWIFADSITLVLYGEAYADAIAPLRILLLGLPFMAATGSLAHQLFAQGKERPSSVSTALALIINTTLCFLLAPEYGITGVALATTAALFSNNALHFFLFHHKAN